MIEIRNLKLPIDYVNQDLYRAAAKKLKISVEKLSGLKILKRALDARKKQEIRYVFNIALNFDGDESAVIKRARDKDVLPYTPGEEWNIHTLCKPQKRPVICGAGPAGLFAALTLALAGAEPIVIERGGDADSRIRAIETFKSTRVLDNESNIQCGEGGAGTFSDGKLTTNTHDPRGRWVLSAFVEAGAPEEILWQAKPHIGTDLLPEVIKNLRKRIISLGGEVRFHTKLVDIIIVNGVLRGIVTDKGEIETDRLIIAAGHSARDLFAMLKSRGAAMERKPFSLGVRIEHPQSLIGMAQYGAAYEKLPAADYKLSCHLNSGRSVYTFCMCPGGEVVAAASENGGVVTNGMSRFARDGVNANSAYLVNVEPDDFGGTDVLAGVEFQRRWEHAAFELGGRNFTAPCQLFGDFLQGVPSSGAGSVLPSYPLGVMYTDLAKCLPSFALDAMRQAAPVFDAKLRGFMLPDAVLTGVETRSSSPVRILRNEKCMSNIQGLYPCGEGAGYAGGIMSAAVDGIRVAMAILE